MSHDADQVTRELVEWVHSRLPKVRVAAIAIGQGAAEDGIDIRLIGVAPRFEPRSRDRLNRTMALDYLLTVRFADPLAEHRNLAELAFAVMDVPGYELVCDRDVAQACLSIGLRASAGLILRTEARRTQELVQAPLVREPAITRFAPLGWVEGLVVGPGDVPIANAVVTLDGTDRCAITGSDGRFRFASPADAPSHATARAKSKEATIAATAGKPAVIKLPLEV